MKIFSTMLAAFLASVVFVSFPLSAAEPPLAEVMNFSLLDYKGDYHELRRADARAVVLFFTENGCPVARQSIAKLKALREHFSEKGVAFWLIDSNEEDDRGSIEQEVKDFDIAPLPVLIDDTQQIARLLHITRTCETVCISTTDWTIFYHGALDDQLAEGAQKPEASQNYLENALNEFLAGKNITRPETAARGCLITLEKETGEGSKPVSYVKEIAPMLRTKCMGCHSQGNIGPFAMSSYQKVRGRGEMIGEVLAARRMPPWDADPRYGVFQHDRSLSLEQKKTLLRWIDQDMPRGEGADPLAEPVTVMPKWPLGEPDYIVKLPEPEEIPANGVLDYRHVKIPSPVTNDAWLSAIVFRPQNKRVVHHLILRAKYKKTPKLAEEDVFLAGWAPGLQDFACPPGTGKFLGKGATLEFELHYTTDGKPETDQSELGLYILKATPKLALQTRAAVNFDVLVPPRESETASYAIYGFKNDTMVYDFAPHMHLRGAWFKYEALYPNGERETLLSAPHYDFNWQTTYRLAEPRKMPAGTWILCTGGFDNSNRNPSNPNPDKRVRWGDQSFDEMFIGFMDVAELPSEKGPVAERGAPSVNN